MTKKNNSAALLAASQKILKMAAQRRKRMEAKAAKVKADEFNAPLPALPEEESIAPEAVLEIAPELPAEPALDVAPAAPSEPVAEPIIDVAPEVAPAISEPAAVSPEAIPLAAPAAPAMGVPAAAAAAAPVSAENGQPPNGGFEGHSLANAPDAGNIGEEEFGVHVPPELASQIDDGKAEDATDESYSPGILVPPGLEDAVMAFVDPAAITSDEVARFDMIPFMPEGATTAAEVLNAGAHWVLCRNGDPLAKVSLGNQDNADKIAGHFVSFDYAKSVVESIGKHGLTATLEFTKAKPYVAKVDENAKIKEIAARLEKAGAEKLRATIADAKSKYVENIALVLRASGANYLIDNPLKDGLITWAVSAGIPEAAAVEGIDNEFFTRGEKTFSGFLDQAETWSNFAPEALDQVKATLDQAGARSRPLPSQMTPAESNPGYDQNLANRMEARAVGIQQPSSAEVPVSAAAPVNSAEPASNDDKADFRRQFGGFGS